VADTNITDITVINIATSTTGVDPTHAKSNFQNLQWYKSGVAVGPIIISGTASTETGVNSLVTYGYKYTFHFTSSVVVPQNSSIALELRGDVASFASGGAQSNSTNNFRIESPSSVTAAGGSLATAISGPNNSTAIQGNTITLARTKLTVTSDATGITTSGHPMSSADVMAVFVFTADSANDVTINTVTLKLAGSSLSSIYVQLIDADAGSVWGTSIARLFDPASSGTASTSVSFAPAYVLSAGATKRVKVQADTTGSTDAVDATFTATTGTTNGTLAQWSVANDAGTRTTYGGITNALCWSDGTALCSAGAFNLEAKNLPVLGPAIRY
jgi:hypothetical protein